MPKNAGNMDRSPGMPESNSVSERRRRSTGGYSEVRAGVSVNNMTMDPVAGSTRQVDVGKEKPKVS